MNPLRIGLPIVANPPWTMPCATQRLLGRYCSRPGILVEVFEYMMKHAKVPFEYVSLDRDYMDYGELTENGTWTGMMSTVRYKLLAFVRGENETFPSV